MSPQNTLVICLTYEGGNDFLIPGSSALYKNSRLLRHFWIKVYTLGSFKGVFVFIHSAIQIMLYHSTIRRGAPILGYFFPEFRYVWPELFLGLISQNMVWFVFQWYSYLVWPEYTMFWNLNKFSSNELFSSKYKQTYTHHI